MKRPIRLLGIVTTISAAALLCWTGAASAQQTYSLTGKAMGQNSRSWLVPVAGPTPCPSFVWGTGMQTMTPAPVTGPITPMYFAQQGCVPGSGTLMTPGGQNADMVGGKITVPTGLFSLVPPGMLQVIPIPTAVSIIQVATSFGLMGPIPSTQRLQPLGATMANGTNTAPWRVFQQAAWMNQTGRAGPTFTWCPGTMGMGITGCPSPAQGAGGARPLIIKNTAGTSNVQGFGGTMGGLFYSGARASFGQARPLGGVVNPMSIALAAIEPCLGLHMNCVKSVETTPFGRGYAAYVVQMAVVADIYSMYQLTTVNPPTYAVIAMVSGLNVGTGPGATQTSANFPWTTGHVIVRQTGMTPQGMINALTVTAMGFDSVSPMGARNIHLVAGKITSAVVGGALTFHYTSIGQGRLKVMPEPGASAALAAAAGLFGIALWRGRRRRA